MKPQQQQPYNQQQYNYTTPSTQPELGKTIESNTANTKYPQLETKVEEGFNDTRN
jgi:hypothetical protein